MFHSMEYIYEVYKERSFSKAAANLYISQPSLSATVKKEEERIGAPVFDRSVNPIQLTECGKQYIKSIEEIMDIQNHFENYINDLNELKTGQLAIGGSNLFASYVLPPLLTRFTQKYPHVRIRLVEANTPQLMDQLFHGALDLVIDNSTFPRDIYERHFFTKESLLLAVPQSYVSNKKAAAYSLTINDVLDGRHMEEAVACVPLALFAAEPFLFLRSGNDTRARAEKICQSQDFTPNIILKLDQQVTSFNLCCYGMGATFISDTMLKYFQQNNDCIFYKLAGEDTSRGIYFYRKQTKYMTRAMQEFLKIASKET